MFHAHGRTDGRTDGPADVTKLVVVFRNFANAPETQVIHSERAKNWDNSVSIATELRTGRYGVRIFYKRSDHNCVPPSLLFKGYRGFLPGSKVAGT